MKAICTYYEEAIAAEQANMDSLGNELPMMEMSRVEAEDCNFFVVKIIYRRLRV